MDNISKCFEKNSKKQDLKNESKTTKKPKKLKEASSSNTLMITMFLMKDQSRQTARICDFIDGKSRRQGEKKIFNIASSNR